MRTAIVLCVAALAAGGCTLLPASAQVALLAIDGVSFIVSKKSVTDHGISLVVQQDCALWRGLTEGQFCYPDGAATMVAEAENAPGQADPGAQVAHSVPMAVDLVTEWARSELAYRKSAVGYTRPLSADASVAPAKQVHIEISGFAPVATVKATIVR